MTAAAPKFVDCPDCDYPLDPAGLPRHQSHDFTPEQIAAMDAADEACAARVDAKRWAQVRAEEQRARRQQARRGTKRSKR